MWVPAPNFTFIPNHLRATGSTNLNITELVGLGQLWSSETLINVGSSLNSAGNNTNIGDIGGNRMFYMNDYMVGDQGFRYRNLVCLPSLRYTMGRVMSVPSGCTQTI